MVTFEDFMERLARGPLKNTAAVEKTNLGEIVPEYWDTIRALTNEGLREISTKKMVTTGRVRVTWVDSQSDYVLKEDNIGVYLSDYSETGEQQFTDDLFVRVTNVWAIMDDDVDDVRVVMDSGQGISTPSFNRLRISSDFRTFYEDGIRVQYQARHPVLTSVASEIDLPPNLEYALQLFVASQYISQMNGAEHTKRGEEYRAKYLSEMGEDEAKNLSSTSIIDADVRFQDRGFV